MSDPCWGCTDAAADPLTGSIQAGCPECEARSLAQSPAYAESEAALRFVPEYREALQRLFGDAWLGGHARVKRWRMVMDQTKGKR